MNILPILLLLFLAGCGEPATGSVQGYVEGEYLHIGALSGGRLTGVAVTKGATIQKDQPLFTLENDLEMLASEEARANLERAKAQRDNLLTGKRDNEIRILEKQREQAQASQRLSALQKRRQESLLKSDATSQSRLDEITSAQQRDEARVAELTAAIASARDGGREAEIAAAEANLKLAENTLQRAAWHLQQRMVRAPDAGRVEEVLFHPGETVNPQQAVITLLPPGKVTIRFFLGAEGVGRLSRNPQVTLTCAGCPEGLTGTVSFIASEAVYAPPVLYSREGKEKLVFAVEAIPAKHAESLRPGQPVTIGLPAPNPS
ncbi:MAG: HlyD family efflux transporter periplasmic adaptor subunit [Magnetococcales bacterium]|nr:HlyD family efflux transporter periplasmic adaptor subunit [Magnetococcales bacterium]